MAQAGRQGRGHGRLGWAGVQRGGLTSSSPATPASPWLRSQRRWAACACQSELSTGATPEHASWGLTGWTGATNKLSIANARREGAECLMPPSMLPRVPASTAPLAHTASPPCLPSAPLGTCSGTTEAVCTMPSLGLYIVLALPAAPPPQRQLQGAGHHRAGHGCGARSMKATTGRGMLGRIILMAAVFECMMRRRCMQRRSRRSMEVAPCHHQPQSSPLLSLLCPSMPWRMLCSRHKSTAAHTGQCCPCSCCRWWRAP